MLTVRLLNSTNPRSPLLHSAKPVIWANMLECGGLIQQADVQTLGRYDRHWMMGFGAVGLWKPVQDPIPLSLHRGRCRNSQGRVKARS